VHVRRTTPGTGTRRLQTLRPFVAHYRQHEPGSEVLDPRILGLVRGRPTPHIYTPGELVALIDAAAALDGGDGLRGATYATLFGLIAVMGLRLSEAIDLKDANVDLAGGRLTVRLTEFRKTRRLPMQESTVAALASWRERRDGRWLRDADGPFFVGHRGAALSRRSVHAVFEGLRRSLGWQARGSHPAPRIHDLRHTFAVRRVQLWHEEGTSIAQAMFWLCTYLGHAKISDTYWYLTGVPELMGVAGRHFELLAGFLDELETVRGNSVRTRNARLAAIRSFLQFASRRDVTYLHSTAKALAVPMKRFERPMFGFLSREQMLAVLALPGTTWLAKRDRLLLHLLYNSGARVSEMIGVRVGDVVTGDGACVHLLGKGRKHRSVPL